MTIFNATPPEAPEVSASLDEGNSADAALPTKMSNKRKRRIAALTIALLILALLFAWYLLNRKPLSELPGLS